MNDEEIAACVAAVVGCSPAGVRVEPLGGKQGLLVCRVSAPDGASYIFKAVRESGRRELALTNRLASLVPEIVPPVLACEEDTHRGLYWLVMGDVGARRLRDSPTTEGYIAAARTLAQVQQATLMETDAFRALGVPVVEAARWETSALQVLEALEQSRNPLLWGAQEEVEEVAWAVPDIAQDTLSLPMALIHGDLHGGNIAISESAYHPSARLADGAAMHVCLMDWGSAYIGPAFLALEELLWPVAHLARSVVDNTRVRAAYLRAWTSLLGKPGPLERAVLACRLLVRLQLVEESLQSPGADAMEDMVATATAVRRLLEAWRQWQRG